jgi:hypothetical protein
MVRRSVSAPRLFRHICASPADELPPWLFTSLVTGDFSEALASLSQTRANKRETIDWLKFTLEGVGEEPWLCHDTTFAGCWI